jgi:hypothetical protein
MAATTAVKGTATASPAPAADPVVSGSFVASPVETRVAGTFAALPTTSPAAGGVNLSIRNVTPAKPAAAAGALHFTLNGEEHRLTVDQKARLQASYDLITAHLGVHAGDSFKVDIINLTYRLQRAGEAEMTTYELPLNTPGLDQLRRDLAEFKMIDFSTYPVYRADSLAPEAGSTDEIVRNHPVLEKLSKRLADYPEGLIQQSLMGNKTSAQKRSVMNRLTVGNLLFSQWMAIIDQRIKTNETPSLSETQAGKQEREKVLTKLKAIKAKFEALDQFALGFALANQGRIEEARKELESYFKDKTYETASFKKHLPNFRGWNPREKYETLHEAVNAYTLKAFRHLSVSNRLENLTFARTHGNHRVEGETLELLLKVAATELAEGIAAPRLLNANLGMGAFLAGLPATEKAAMAEMLRASKEKVIDPYLAAIAATTDIDLFGNFMADPVSSITNYKARRDILLAPPKP